jgi:hypothetical protein
VEWVVRRTAAWGLGDATVCARRGRYFLLSAAARDCRSGALPPVATFGRRSSVDTRWV